VLGVAILDVLGHGPLIEDKSEHDDAECIDVEVDKFEACTDSEF
jgi:hypothetical protein